jgi:hypothetical protein
MSNPYVCSVEMLNLSVDGADKSARDGKTQQETDGK